MIFEWFFYQYKTLDFVLINKVIAATGFKSGLDKVLEDYAEKIPGSNESELRKKLGLFEKEDLNDKIIINSHSPTIK